MFRNLSKDQGLPNFVVTAFADAHGFLWVGTQDGQGRWDGYRFRVYRANENEPSSFPDNFILAFHNDIRDRFWVGTSRIGLPRYDAD